MLGLFTSAVQAASESSTTEARRRPCSGGAGVRGFSNLSHRIVVMSNYAYATEQRSFHDEQRSVPWRRRSKRIRKRGGGPEGAAEHESPSLILDGVAFVPLYLFRTRIQNPSGEHTFHCIVSYPSFSLGIAVSFCFV